VQIYAAWLTKCYFWTSHPRSPRSPPHFDPTIELSQGQPSNNSGGNYSYRSSGQTLEEDLQRDLHYTAKNHHCLVQQTVIPSQRSVIPHALRRAHLFRSFCASFRAPKPERYQAYTLLLNPKTAYTTASALVARKTSAPAVSVYFTHRTVSA
jgi:hypothetical protein